jgi:hypothetical protein
VADKLYDNFVASLKAAGVEAVPQAELDAKFQEIRKLSPKAPLINVRTTVAMVEPKGKGSGRTSQFGNMVTKTASWEFGADVQPRFVDGGSAVMVHGLGLSGLPSQKNVLTLVKPVAITGLQLSAESGEGGASARGSGLLGAIGRAAGGTDQAADAYVDIDPGNFSSSATAAGTKVLDLFAKALTTP